MSIIASSTITAAVALGPISQILPPQYRFVADDWDDETQFLFTFYTVLPTFGPSTTDPNTGATIPGPVLTPGQVRDLTGCTFSGTVEYAPPPNPFRVAVMWDPSPTAMVGQINMETSQGALTLPSAQTQFRPQSPDLWQPDQQGFESGALLQVRARITDPNGVTTTAAVVPLFVF